MDKEYVHIVTKGWPTEVRPGTTFQTKCGMQWSSEKADVSKLPKCPKCKELDKQS